MAGAHVRTRVWVVAGTEVEASIKVVAGTELGAIVCGVDFGAMALADRKLCLVLRLFQVVSRGERWENLLPCSCGSKYLGACSAGPPVT